MDLEKRYETAEGIKCNILQMVKIEPEWAANRIQDLEACENSRPSTGVVESISICDYCDRE